MLNKFVKDLTSLIGDGEVDKAILLPLEKLNEFIVKNNPVIRFICAEDIHIAKKNPKTCAEHPIYVIGKLQVLRNEIRKRLKKLEPDENRRKRKAEDATGKDKKQKK